MTKRSTKNDAIRGALLPLTNDTGQLLIRTGYPFRLPQPSSRSRRMCADNNAFASKFRRELSGTSGKRTEFERGPETRTEGIAWGSDSIVRADSGPGSLECDARYKTINPHWDQAPLDAGKPRRASDRYHGNQAPPHRIGVMQQSGCADATKSFLVLADTP
jgi:hypothetical protein